MKKTLIAFLTVLCVGFSLMAWAAPKLSVENMEIKQGEFLIVYPHVKLQNKLVVNDKINTFLARNAQSELNAYEAERATGVKKTMEEKYSQSYYGDHYLGFVNSGYMFYKGAAHPLSWKSGIVFDLKTGNSVKWQQLVRQEDQSAFTLEAINAKIFASKAPWRQWLYRDFQGLKELPKTYYLDKDGYIHFIFGQYEIAPYAAGILDLNMEKHCK
jgi:hypothetical protein